MELKIYSPTTDGFIKAIEWNHEDIKKEVAAKVEKYMNLVYTDDQIKAAKADRATLNKFVQALETKRKEIKKQCLAPYESFEKEMKEIIGVVQQPISIIDSQINGYEDQQKADKLDAIKGYFASCEKPFEIDIDLIMDLKWLNASVKLPTVYKAIDDLLEQVAKDLATLRILPEFAFEAEQVYKDTLDVNKAIAEAHKMAEIQKAKIQHWQEEEARKVAALEAEQTQAVQLEVVTPQAVMEQPAEPEKAWVSFKALLSTEDALELKKFFLSRKIEFMPLQ